MNPLDARAPATGKTRYSARAKTISATNKAAKVKKENDKKKATPTPATPEELAVSRKVQAAPLGLNGDTSKTKKQPKDKNAPKERLQNQPP